MSIIITPNAFRINQIQFQVNKIQNFICIPHGDRTLLHNMNKIKIELRWSKDSKNICISLEINYSVHLFKLNEKNR